MADEHNINNNPNLQQGIQAALTGLREILGIADITDENLGKNNLKPASSPQLREKPTTVLDR